ncbi:hypothetical protein B0533_04685 [Sedimentibacter sp. SX930]|nr:hypothetical protein B0533_04685 [Sedimentibacter sp. SX930]
MDIKVELFIQLISDSLENVGGEYYRLTTTYEPLGIVRERVFCYELYHQMRLGQYESGLTDVQIHGEIDKSGHVAFDRNARKNPDFVFHIPGMMQGNAIVVEVKGKIEGNYQEGVYKDIVTLSKFTHNKHYYHSGILIIYNYTYDEFLRKIGEFLKNRLQENKFPTDKIIIICKKSKSIPSVRKNLNELLEEVE